MSVGDNHLGDLYESDGEEVNQNPNEVINLTDSIQGSNVDKTAPSPSELARS